MTAKKKDNLVLRAEIKRLRSHCLWVRVWARELLRLARSTKDPASLPDLVAGVVEKFLDVKP